MKIRRNNPFVIFLVVLGLLIFLHFLHITKPLENFFVKLSQSVGATFYQDGTRFNFSYQSGNREELLQKIDELNKEVDRLLVSQAKVKETEEENKRLKKILKFRDDYKLKTVLGQIIAKESLSNFNDEEQDIIINKGKKDGVELGSAVVNETGVVVGKIIEAKDNISKACLVTSPGCRLAATIQNESQTVGLTDGDLGLTIKMNYIPQSEHISSGDLIISSGLEKNIPRGLLIGKVLKVNSESNDIWQEAVITPIVNFNNLTLVSIVIP